MDKYINNKVNANTKYYRRNKKLRLNIKSCPHCNYETTGPKSSLQAHIWAKHTPENKRPFQCPCDDCSRGFASRANLHKHIKSIHKIKIPKKLCKDIVLLKLSLQKKISETKNSFYNNYKVIKCCDLPIYHQNTKFTIDTLFYDTLKGNILMEGYSINKIRELYN
tara:strand:- start:822 stop:1316 length:495 start_codon:yes stop_codon:yes gene_type:complete